MKTVLLITEIYSEAFRDLGHILVKSFFKAFAWFSFLLFLIVMYAFVFRLFSGFAFD